MCEQVTAGRQFDPDLCPLLATLPADEQQRRMREDEKIRTCMTAVEGDAPRTEAAAKLVEAYDRLCAERAARDAASA